jgi:Ca-activated chloride channel family protein
MAIGYRLVPGRVLLLLVLLVVGTTNVVIAQQNQSGPLVATIVPADDTPEFKIVKRVDEVNLRFTVTDSHGHFQNQLSSSDFSVLDNHQPPVAIHFFQQQSTLPMRVGILIDASASVAAKFKFEQKAAGFFLQKVLRPGYDEAFVVTFDKNVRLLADWFSDPKTAFSKLYTLHAGGDTALYDAVIFACDKLHQNSADMIARPVIVLITDGDDTASKATLLDAEQTAARAETILFSLSTNVVTSGHYPKGEAVLDLLSGPTGGRILPAHEIDQLASAFAQIEQALRSEYVLGYQPADLKPDGSFRPVEIRPLKAKLQVRSRRGYYAPRDTTTDRPF